MILSCDIGNSSSSFGLFDEKSYVPAKIFRIDTEKIKNAQDLKKLFSKHSPLKNISAVSISSVAPSLNPLFNDFFAKAKLEPFYISAEAKLNIKICIENKNNVGSDRIANASYAYFFNQYKKFQIIIDLGTAITIDVVNKKGIFFGGIIYPGINSLVNCLYESTEKLPLVKIIKTQALIGTNTELSIQSGVYNGTLFLIKGFIENICDYYNIYGMDDVRVVFTGGLANLIFDDIDVKVEKILDENFTLKGIKYIYDINNK